jgi:hypothetical protein
MYGGLFGRICSLGLNMEVRVAEIGSLQACSCLSTPPRSMTTIWSASLGFSAGCAGTSKIDSKRAPKSGCGHLRTSYALFVDLIYRQKESFHTGVIQCKHFVKPFKQASLRFAFQPPDHTPPSWRIRNSSSKLYPTSTKSSNKVRSLHI